MPHAADTLIRFHYYAIDYSIVDFRYCHFSAITPLRHCHYFHYSPLMPFRHYAFAISTLLPPLLIFIISLILRH
jgi:hypothetical protein